MSAINHQANDLVGGRSRVWNFPPWKRVGLYVVLIVGIFLAGLIPMWLKARENANQRDVAQRELRLSQMQNTLAAATINARRGEYELARQMTSDFFTTLRSQIDKGNDSALTTAQRENLRPLLVSRDDLITFLARSDPASAYKLSDLYVSYGKAMNSIPKQSESR